MLTITLFIILTIVAEGLITAVQLLFTRKELKNSVRITLAAVKLLIAILFAFLTMAGPTALRPVQLYMTVLYAVMFPEAVIQLIAAVVCAVSHKKAPFGLTKALCFAAAVIFVVAGMINSQTIRPSYHTYTSEKLREEHTFVYLSDLHYGTGQRINTVRKAFIEINKLDPDFIILGGDITDDFTNRGELRTFFNDLTRNYDKPVYFVFGNHDRPLNTDQYTEEFLLKILKESGITVLDDKYICISGDLELLGREDLSAGDKRKDVSELPNAVPDHYLVIADHQPVDIENNLKLKPDLQLSGHAHAGQFFPLRVFYDLFICKSAGEKKYGDTVLNVTPGMSGWRFPFRTEAKCQYEVITLKPAQ